MAFAAPDHWQVHDETGRRKYVNSAERGRFLEAAERLPPAQRALCVVLIFTGCRISEALALTREHVDVERRTITFRTLKRRRI
ncbi:MAG TPA: site-specific integrase, partial [Kaistia sp.]|nr:site-specific integrase [Kaistia sp.]